MRRKCLNPCKRNSESPVLTKQQLLWGITCSKEDLRRISGATPMFMQSRVETPQSNTSTRPKGSWIREHEKS